MSQIFMCDFICDGRHMIYHAMKWLPRIGECMYIGRQNYKVEGIYYKGFADLSDVQNVEVRFTTKG